MMNICKQNNWKYIFNIYDKLKTILKGLNNYIEYFNKCTTKNYFLDNNYKFKRHKFNIIRFTKMNKYKNNILPILFIMSPTLEDDKIV